MSLRSFFHLSLALAGLALTPACPRARADRPPPSGPAPATTPESDAGAAFDVAYRGGLQPGWQDYGWCERHLRAGAPASLDLRGKGGWILARPDQVQIFDVVAFTLRAPPGWRDFLA